MHFSVLRLANLSSQDVTADYFLTLPPSSHLPSSVDQSILGKPTVPPTDSHDLARRLSPSGKQSGCQSTINYFI